MTAYDEDLAHIHDAGFGDFARGRVPEGEFDVGSFLELPIPRCRAITALGECFNYLFDEYVHNFT